MLGAEIHGVGCETGSSDKPYHRSSGAEKLNNLKIKM
jgi:hypothetical protein